jgi:hypothetical protein
MSEVRLDYPVDALMSFHYFARHDLSVLAAGGLRLIADCGAYSAASQGVKIDRDAFFEWVAKWRHSVLWAASLDVIGDLAATWDNWVSAPPELRLVPTVHYGAEPSALDRYVEAGADLIGLGGMVPYKSEPDRLLRWCLAMMRYARDRHPHVRFHGWGVTHRQLVTNLPWWSVDSSGFGSSYRYGTLRLYDPDAHKNRQFRMDGREVAAAALLLRTHYGVRWSDVAAVNDNRSLRAITRLSVRSVQLQARQLQRQHRVTPPASLIPALEAHATTIGPLMACADSALATWQACLNTGPLVHCATGNRPSLDAMLHTQPEGTPP